MKLFAEMLVSVFELYIIYVFFKELWKPKDIKRIWWITVGVTYTMASTLLYHYDLPVWLDVLLSIMCLFLPSLLFKAKLVSKIIFTCIITIIFLAVDAGTGYLIMVITGKSEKEIVGNIMYFICGIFFTKFLVYLIIKLISLRRKRATSSYTKSTMAFVIFPACSTIIILVTHSAVLLLNVSIITMLAAVSVLLMIIANVYLIVVIEKSKEAENTKRRLQFAEGLLEKEKEYYNEFVKEQQQNNKVSHDIKNALFAAAALLEKEDINGSLNKINDLTERFTDIYPKMRTGNFSIDALLGQKSKIMEENDIHFICEAVIPNESDISDIELCIIIGNAFDNAIEACLKISEPLKREIVFKARCNPPYLVMMIQNVTADTSPISLLTRKENPSMHGFGVENIKTICSEHSGSAEFEKSGNVFSVHMTLKIQNSI